MKVKRRINPHLGFMTASYIVRTELLQGFMMPINQKRVYSMLLFRKPLKRVCDDVYDESHERMDYHELTILGFTEGLM